jgi:simple sugar transport system permease protein
VPLIGFALMRTAPGLKLRMVGENPSAAEAQGVDVARTRTVALVLCGTLAAAGGAYLALAYAKTFVEGMSAGRGFIALAIVIRASPPASILLRRCSLAWRRPCSSTSRPWDWRCRSSSS